LSFCASRIMVRNGGREQSRFHLAKLWLRWTAGLPRCGFWCECFMSPNFPARVWFLVLTVLIVGYASSCSSEAKGRRTVGVSVLTLRNQIFRVVGKHLTAALEKA